VAKFSALLSAGAPASPEQQLQVHSTPTPPEETELLLENGVRAAIAQFGAERFARALCHSAAPGGESFASPRSEPCAIEGSELPRELELALRQVGMLLAHCPDDECPTCAVIICPQACSLHFHHDGCPACAEGAEMSWEAWGTPPDSEPELCPICDNTQHTPDKCEIAASEAHSRAYLNGVLELLRADHERQLTNAYAEGRKDQAEESFRDGWLDCRATMARFVEPNSPAIAMSIRANWKPSLGDDPERRQVEQRCEAQGASPVKEQK
jgi:hypothetical protein